MEFPVLIIIIVVSLLYRLFFNKKGVSWFIFVASILLLYYFQPVSTVSKLDVEQSLDLDEIFVMVTEQGRQQRIVVELKLNQSGVGRFGHGQTPILSGCNGTSGPETPAP